MNILDLPDDCIFLIYQQITSYFDLINFSKTNKLFYSLLTRELIDKFYRTEIKDAQIYPHEHFLNYNIEIIDSNNNIEFLLEIHKRKNSQYYQTNPFILRKLQIRTDIYKYREKITCDDLENYVKKLKIENILQDIIYREFINENKITRYRYRNRKEIIKYNNSYQTKVIYELRSIANYENSIKNLHGEHIIYKDGKIITKEYYKNNKLEGKRFYTDWREDSWLIDYKDGKKVNCKKIDNNDLIS